MRDTSPRRWHRWRVNLANPAQTPGANRLKSRRAPASVGATTTELPGPDGIRHELVARIRREIAEGTYDTEEKWLAAEEELLRRISERM